MQNPVATATEGQAQALGNMENYFSYSVFEWEAISHVLTLGFGVFAAAVIYFLATVKTVHPKFRVGNVLSGVVMISALLILLRQAIDWDMAFTLNSATGEYERKEGEVFSNGYRYMNWSIDVPVLLVQMLFVLPLAGAVKRSRSIQFVIAGLGMIWTSWAAQFFETGGQVGDTSSAAFWLWYGISWAFYVWVIAIVFKTVADAKKELSTEASRWLTAILWLLVISWTAYSVAIAMPQLWWDSGGSVARQFIFTIADVVSKAVYGVMLAHIALIRTREIEASGQEHAIL